MSDKTEWLCPKCGKAKKPDSIGHKHTGHLCFYCGYSTDAPDRQSIKEDGEWLLRAGSL